MTNVATPLLATRHELAHRFVGEGVELGVASGSFSAIILCESKCKRLWSIDTWSDHHDAAQYKRAALRLAKIGRGRCVVLRMPEVEAASLFPDASLNFVYFDLYAHLGQGGIEALERWWVKVVSGGLFAGHDFYEPKWPKTVQVVREFAAAHGLKINVTAEVPTIECPLVFPSWFIRKP